MNHLLTLPPEVMEHALFPFLKWNDLLRLRRVSKASKALVHDYVKVHPELAPEIGIRGKVTERNLRAFLDLGLPSTKICLNNYLSRSEFYQDYSEELSEFLEVCGPVVTHLRVHHFSLYCSGMERSFLEGLVNLQRFTADWFDTKKVAGAEVLPVPRVFENVTVLKLLSYDHGEYLDNYDKDAVNGTIELLTACKMLKTVKMESIVSDDDNSLNTKLFRFLDAAISQREDNPEGAPLSHLQVIDFNNDADWIDFLEFEDDEDIVRAENDYRQFLRDCAVHGIRLQNVEVCEVLIDFAKYRGHLQLPFESLSLKSVQPYNWIWATKTEMPILKHLVVRTCGLEFDEDEVEDMRIIDEDRVKSCSDNWPMLTKLALTFKLPSRCKRNEDTARLVLRETRDLVRMLFQGVCYQILTELTLDFNGEVGNDILTAESLITSCPNLTKLKLVKWGGNNKQFVRLWEGLPHLEVVILDSCDKLGDDGFIGPDAQNPAFLKLKKLKNLSLLELYSMPGITDNLFSTVIRHLSLTHFDISSSWIPSKNVTSKGIKSLIGGRFEETIQKFPFKDWSLDLSTWFIGEPMWNLQELFAHRLENML